MLDRTSRALLFVLWLGPCLAAPAAAAERVIYSDAQGDLRIASAQPGGVGDQIFWNSALQDEAGAVIGDSTGSCVVVDPNGVYLCSSILALPEGRLAISGRHEPKLDEDIWIITGGSQGLAGATGWIVSTRVEDGARFRYVLHFQEN